MKISKRVRNGYALALVFALALPCLVKVQTQAALAIDVDEDCSLTVSVADSEYRDEFADLSIPVSLYKVADVDASGRYTAADAFAEMKGSFDKIGSRTTAEEWSELTKEAVGCLEGLDPEYPVYTVKVEKTAGGADAAEGVFTGLKPGMYLVAPEAVYDKDYAVQYQFTPYLTALPSSDYALSGAGSDEWNYHTTIGLKADSQELPGKLDIVKNLKNYNETLGQVTFVFQVDGYDENNNLVYSNVASTTHQGAGSETVTVDGIPAGLNVVVTEVYRGASYEIEEGTSEVSEPVKIWSGIAVNGVGSDGTVIIEEELRRPGAVVTFSNEYDGGNRGGYGVTNHFKSDGADGWTWENPTEPAGQ